MTHPPLFHFSDDGKIDRFVPRRVRQPTSRKPGFEWLNEPLVWAIDAIHQQLYLFPRECPRIVIWAHDASDPADRIRWMGNPALTGRAVAFIEKAWADRFGNSWIYRYELPRTSFESIEDAGMHVSRSSVVPMSCQKIENLAEALKVTQTELRIVDSLSPLRGVWDSTLNASGIRLRNASDWE